VDAQARGVLLHLQRDIDHIVFLPLFCSSFEMVHVAHPREGERWFQVVPGKER